MSRFSEWMEKHRSKLMGILATIFVLIFLFFVIDHIVMPIYTHHGEEEELPDITEKPYAEAKRILEERGFTIIKEAEKYDATYPESTVVSQNPVPFARVKKGRRIYVTLSAGERLIQVPRVIGLSERDAEFSLRQAGVTLGEIYYEYHSYHLSGVVFSQSVDANMEVVEHTPVDITVSMGRQPDRFIVPDVMGKSLEMATRLLRRAGLRVGDITYEVEQNLVPDTIIRQSRDGGEEVMQGTAINLVVSRLEEEF